MKPEDYKVKPEIRGAKDLLKFLRAIPAKYWCTGQRNDGNGNHCVLGHLDNAYGRGNGRDGFSSWDLFRVNDNSTIGVNDTPSSIKRRVLAYIKKRT